MKSLKIITTLFFLLLLIATVSPTTEITDNQITTTGNLSIGEKITFALGQIIQATKTNWINIIGTLNVSENIVSQKNISANYFLGDGSKISNLNLSQNNIVIVSQESDLPPASEGKIQLKDNTAYYFNGFVTSTNTLVLANTSPLLGNHAGLDGFIHLGGNSAIEGTNSNLMLRNIYIHAPGGTIFNLTADNVTEMLVESCAFSDAAGIGNIQSLGKITGYRVPTFKGANFENFNKGLTFTGDSEKIFISSSPFRKINSTNVTILNFSSSLDVDIVDIVNCYFKELQPDTVVINSEAGSLANDIFQYRGNTHDSTVNESNILTGVTTPTSKGTKIVASYPLSDSNIGGIVQSTESKTITGSGANFTKIDLNTEISDIERTLMPENSTIQYNSKFNTEVIVYALVKVSGAATDDFKIRFNLNNNSENRTETSGSLFNTKAYTTLTLIDKMKLTEGDNITVEIKNEDGTADLTVNNFILSI